MNKITKEGDKPFLVVLDGGAFKGAVQHALIAYLREKNVAVGGYAGISIGSLNSTLACNDRTQEDMRSFMLDVFLKEMNRGFKSALLSPKRMMFGGAFNQVPVMKQVVKDLDLKQKPNLKLVTYDLFNKCLFVFDGEDYDADDLPYALAAACAPYPAVCPVEYVDKNGTKRLLADAAAYLLHARKFNQPTLIARLFPVSLRKPQQDEFAVMIGYPHGKILRRPSEAEYDRYWQYGYQQSVKQVGPLIAGRQIPIQTK